MSGSGKRKKEQGAWAEQIAADHLEANGWRVVDRNYDCVIGEIDIVCEGLGDQLVFVEVRSAGTDYLESPSLTVDRGKQSRIIRTARWYMADRDRQDAFVRFDVVAVEANHNGVVQVDWYEDAFRPEESGQKQRFLW
jgi:putative endonuclease